MQTVKAKIIISLPAGDVLRSGFSVIPEIDNAIRQGAWQQPLRSVISFHTSGPEVKPMEVKAAYMNQANMELLDEYSTTLPTGVYPGKMWKAYWQDDHGDWAWYLCWFDDSKEHPGVQCSVNHCPIMLHEVIMLLNPGG